MGHHITQITWPRQCNEQSMDLAADVVANQQSGVDTLKRPAYPTKEITMC